MCTQRRWTKTDFERFLIQHPLVRHLTRRIVWATYDTEGRLLRTFRVAEDGTLADAQDNDFQLADGERVGIPHPVTAELRSWGEVFADYELLQPFPQMNRPIFRPTEKERDAQSTDRFHGTVVPAGALFGMSKWGWWVKENSLIFQECRKQLSRTTVGLWFADGLDVEVGPRGEPQSLGSLYLQKLTFGDLDPVEFSELFYDVERLTASS